MALPLKKQELNTHCGKHCRIQRAWRGSQRLKKQVPTRLCPRPLSHKSWLLAQCFYGTPKSGSSGVSGSLACSPPIEWPFPVSTSRLFLYLIISCFGVFSCCCLETCFFLKEKRRKVDLGVKERGRELGGVGGGVSVVGIYCTREESIFKKTKVLT